MIYAIQGSGGTSLSIHGSGWSEETMFTLNLVDIHSIAYEVDMKYVVRRLTPTECERLQSFPDGWTDIEYKGKKAPDGARYKALGNSMTVNVMKWIGERLQSVDEILKEKQND